MEQIRNFDQLLQAALAHGRKGIAVAAPYDRNTLLAVKDALASGLASHLIVLQIPGLDRLLISTDGGLNIAPTLTEKADILRNAIDVARALGIETPKAACLAAVETVNPKMQATVDAACLCKMADRGAFPGPWWRAPWPWTTSSPPRLPGKRASTPRCPAMPTSSWPRPSRWPTPSPRP